MKLDGINAFTEIDKELILLLEQIRDSGIKWLKEKDKFHNLKRSEVSKVVEDDFVQYSLDLIFLEEEIDDFRGNWLGCIATIKKEDENLELKVIVHSIYSEIEVIRYLVSNSNDVIETIAGIAKKKNNEIDVEIKKILDEFLENMEL